MDLSYQITEHSFIGLRKVEEGMKLSFVVSHIEPEENLLKVWIQKDPLSLQRINECIEKLKYYLEGPGGYMHQRQLTLGSRYLVKPNDSNNWFRAVIVRHHPADGYLVVVHYIDYGHNGLIHVSNVRSFNEKLFSIVPQATKCILAGVASSTGEAWSQNAVEYLTKILKNKEFLGSVVNVFRDIPYIQIMVNGIPLSHLLIEKRLGVPIGANTMPQQSSLMLAPIETYRALPVDVTQEHLVYVSHIESPQKFYIQLAYKEPELNGLMEHIERYSKEQGFYPMQQIGLLPGTPCITQFSEDGAYYRAVVTAVMGNTCRVMYVDYGNSETKPCSELKALPHQFLTLPAQARECALPTEFSVDTNAFHEAVDDKVLTCHIIRQQGTTYFVMLYCDGAPIFAKLPLNEPNYTLLNVQLGTTHNIFVTYVYNPLRLYCQLAENTAQIDSLRADLASFYQKLETGANPICANDCKPGKPVCAKFTEDELWYRAVVLTPVIQRTVAVQFVDYGNEDKVDIDNIKKLNPNLLQLPIQGIPISLSGLEAFPLNILESSAVVDELERLTLNILLVAKFESKKEDSYCVSLFNISSSPAVCINSKIMEFIKGSNSNDRQPVNTVQATGNTLSSEMDQKPSSQAKKATHDDLYPLLLEGTLEEVIVIDSSGPESFHCQLQRDSSELDKLMDELATHYNMLDENEHSLPSLILGSFCVAKFTVDDNWYRAKIVGVIRGGATAEVLYVDYGNREQLNSSRIKRIMPQFLVVPFKAVECSLANFDVSAVPANVVESFNSMVLDASFTAVFKGRKGYVYNVELLDSEENSVSEKLQQMYKPKASNLWESKKSFVSSNDNGLWNEGAKEPVSSGWESKSESVSIGWENKNEPAHSGWESKKEHSSSGWGSKKESSDNSGWESKKEPSSSGWESKKAPSSSGWGSKKELSNSGWEGKKEVNNSNWESKKEHSSSGWGSKKEPSNSGWGSSREPANNSWDYKKESVTSGTNNIWNDEPANNDSNVWDETESTKKTNQSSSFDSYSANKPRRKEFGEQRSFDRSNSQEKRYQRDSGGGRQSDRTQGRNQRNKFRGSNWNDERSCSSSQQDESWSPKENKNPLHSGFSSHETPFHYKNKCNAAIEITEYKEMDITCGSLNFITVLKVVNPNEFYCQLDAHAGELTVIMEQIGQIYGTLKGDELNLNSPQVGQICCALYPKDHAWYRARIKNIISDCAEVFFVDNGNSETVALTNIKTLKQEFLNLPMQAVRCSCLGIKPNGASWTETDISTFRDMAEGKSLVAQFISKENDGTYLVSLVAVDTLMGGVLNKEFLKSGHGKKEETGSPHLKVPYSLSLQVNLTKPVLNIGKKTEVSVTWAFSIEMFFCQLISFSSQFQNMMNEIQREYNSLSELEAVIDRPQINTYCMSQFSEDGGWYRAKIMHIQGNDIGVYYVDYGNNEIVGRRSIKYILPQFTSLPSQAIKCILNGIKAVNSSTINENILQKYFVGNTFCTFLADHGEYYSVDLENSGKSVAQLLVDDNLAAPTSNAEANISESICQESFSKTDFTLKRGKSLEVVISYAPSPFTFWCQLTSELQTLDEISSEIESQYSNKMDEEIENHTNLHAGDPCVAKFTDDGKWYRAVVKSFDADKAEVCFIDYGNSDVVPLNQVKIITPTLKSKPAQAVCCILYRLPPTLTEEQEAQFVESVDGETMVIQPLEVNVNGILVVKLYDNSSDPKANVAEKLYGEVLEDAPAVIYPHAVPDGLVDGYISLVTSISEFYVQLASDEDDIYKMKEDLAQCYEALSPEDLLIASPEEQMACCAKYSEDGCWYRAVIKKIEGVSCTVCFVDFGNEEILSLSDIKVLKEEFLALPSLALKCYLKDVEPISGETWSTSANDWLFEFTQGKTLQIQFHSKDEPIPVTLTTGGGDIADNMISAELAVKEEESLPEVDLAQYVEREIQYKTEKLAIVSHVSSAKSFYITFADKSDDLYNFHNKLQEMYSEESKQLIDCFVSQRCVAKYSEDEAWYRAEVEEISCENAVIRFIDYGNSETTRKDYLKVLHHDLQSIDPFAVKCTLFGFEPNPERLEEAKSLLETLIQDKEVKIEIVKKETPYCVNLKVDDEYIGPELLEGDLYMKTLGKADSEKMQLQDLGIQLDETPGDVRKSKCFATVSHVASATLFYITFADKLDELYAFHEQLQQIYSGESDQLTDITLCQKCVVKYSFDEAWYRAEVIEISEETVTVRFLDYGNAETVPRSSLKTIHPDLLSVEPFAVECTLDRLEPKSDHLEDAKILLEELILEKNVCVEIIKEHQPLYIDLKIDSKSIANQLIESSLFLPSTDVSTSTLPITSDLDNVHVETSFTMDELKKVQEQDVETLQEDTTSVKKNEHSAVVRHVVSAKLFYITFSDKLDEVDDLHNRLQQIYNDESDYLTDCALLQKCVVKYGVDDTWYRAEVTEISEELVTVRFLDYGNTEITTINNLKTIHPDLLSAEPFAVECMLHGLDPRSDHLEDAKVLLEELILEKDVCVEVIGEHQPLNVDLKVDNEPIATQLLRSNLFLQTSDSSNMGITELPICDVDNLHRETCEAADSKKMHKHFKVSLQEDVDVNNNEHSATVQYVVSATLFYITFSDKLAELEDFHGRLQQIYNDESDQLIDCTVSQKCVVKYSEDEAWYRAEIIEVSEEIVTVKFLDYGNTEATTKNNVKIIQPDLLSVDAFALECTLYGLEPKSDRLEEAKILLEELILGKDVYVKIIGEHQPLSVDLKVDNESIITQLLHSSFFLQTSDSSEMEINENTKSTTSVIDSAYTETCDTADSKKVQEQDLKMSLQEDIVDVNNNEHSATVQYVVSAKSFYIIFSDKVAELEEFHERLQQLYNDESSQLVDCTLSQKCVVGYREDEAWYRAEIIEVSGETVTVRFLDYGNTETVPRSILKTIHPDLLSVDAFSLECTLHGLEPKSDHLEEAKILLEELILGKDVYVKIIGEHQPLSVDLKVDNESIITQLLHSNLFCEITTEVDLKSVPECILDNTEVIPTYDINDDSLDKFYVSVPLRENTVTVCYAISPSEFYVNLCDNLPELNMLEEEIENIYGENTTIQELADVSIGQICIALNPLKQKWSRARITGKGEDDVEVVFVDYGNKVSISWDSIKQILPELQCLPFQAVKCSLGDVYSVDGKDWNEDTCTFFRELVTDEEKVLLAKFEEKKDCYIVRLLDMENDVESLLVENAMACRKLSMRKGLPGLKVDENSGASKEEEFFSDEAELQNTTEANLELSYDSEDTKSSEYIVSDNVDADESSGYVKDEISSDGSLQNIIDSNIDLSCDKNSEQSENPVISDFSTGNTSLTSSAADSITGIPGEHTHTMSSFGVSEQQGGNANHETMPHRVASEYLPSSDDVTEHSDVYACDKSTADSTTKEENTADSHIKKQEDCDKRVQGISAEDKIVPGQLLYFTEPP